MSSPVLQINNTEMESSFAHLSKEEFLEMFKTTPAMIHLAMSADLGLASRDPRIVAYELRISPEQVKEWSEAFIHFQIWIRNDKGQYRFESQSLGQNSVANHILHFMDSASILTDFGPAYFGYRYAATTKDLAYDFQCKLQKLMQEFMEKSAASEKSDTLVNFNFTLVDVMDSIKVKRLEDLQ